VSANTIMVQDTTATDTMAADATEAVQTPPVADTTEDQADAAMVDEPRGFHQELKQRFIEGDPTFMAPILLCLILGLAISIERIIYLNMSTTNTRKLAERVEDALNSGGIDAALDVCRNTKGPVASIYYQ